MRHHVTDAIESLERTISNNKWFTLACVVAVFICGSWLLTSYATRDHIADCFRDTSDIAYGSPRHSGDMYMENGEAVHASIASGDLARAYFGMCLAVNGVDVRSVPPFEDLFPRMTVSKNFQNESFDVLDSGIYEANQ